MPNDQPEETTQGDSSIPPEQESRIIDRIFDKIMEVVGPEVERHNAGEPPPPAAPSGPAQTEADFEAQVSRAVDEKITKKERQSEAAERRRAHDEEHEKIRAVVERPPVVHSRLTTALWGADE